MTVAGKGAVSDEGHVELERAFSIGWDIGAGKRGGRLPKTLKREAWQAFVASVSELSTKTVDRSVHEVGYVSPIKKLPRLRTK